MIGGKTNVCGVMGYPVGHTRSPQMHNLFAARTGTDLVYVPFAVEPERLGDAVRGAYGLGILGLNVTVPHKQEVMNYLSEIDGDARAIGAVNTLVRTDSGYKGYNTDAAGLARALREGGMAISGRTCILIGAGGAAKAAAYVLAKEQAAKVYVLNRSVDRAERLARDINGAFGREALIPMELSGWREIPETDCLAVQTTSVGMYPHVDDVVIDAPAFYQKIGAAMDAIYTPAETRFLRMAREAGARTMNGLSMLLYQGVIAFELWNPGVTVPEDAVEEARAQILKKENVILIGFMGAGKTSVGACLAARTGRPLLDTDQLIEAEAGMTISRIFAEKGEAYFRDTEMRVLERLLSDTDRAVISVGGGLPLRAENREKLKRLGTVIFLRVKRDTVLARLAGDTTRPLLAGADKEEKADRLLAERNPIYEEAAHVVIDVDGLTPEEIADQIEAACGQKTT